MMSAPEDGDGTPPAHDPAGPVPSHVRVGFLLTLGLLAAVLVIAAQSQPQVEEARLGRRVELVELIRIEQARNQALQARVEELAARLAEYERGTVGNPVALRALREDIDRVVAPAGVTAVRGPGLVVTLTDSSLRASPSDDLNDLVIHEQDLQAVINALWAGGAEAMAVNGQRILATTAIRCVGNTLLLHGSVYSPPYVIEAIGDEVALRGSMERDPAVEQFQASVQEFQLGFSVASADELLVKPFEGLSALSVARPAERSRS